MFAYVDNDNNVSNYTNPSIPATQLGYGTNNRFPEFPPLMQDGRSILSSWQPEAVINDRILKNNGIKSNWEYRRFLSQNAKEILDHNFREACNDTGFNMTPPYAHSNGPYLYEGIEDTTVPLGVQNSDLKQLYLSREQLDARKVAPQVTQEELFALRKLLQSNY